MSAIKVENLSKNFKGFTAVDNLSFEVAKNHVVGFLGPNGAGKTTTLRMLVGLSRPSSGGIEIAGVPVRFGSPESNLKVGYLPELPQFYGWMTGREFLQFVADLFELANSDAKINDLLKLVDLGEAADKKISSYSGGMKQRLGIAQALINDPEVIILDEPVSALDPIGRKEVLTVIEKLKKDRTVLFSTHILSDVDRVCDDVVLLNRGKLVVTSGLGELKSKYAKPILVIEFVSDPGKFAAEIKNASWAEKFEQNGSEVKVWVKEGAVKDNEVLKFLANSPVGVLKYGLTLPETEDLFMELLGGDNG